MVILALDTTTRGGSVAVARDDACVSLVRGDETRTHGERIPAEIARAIHDAGLSKADIDLIAVAAGPGAFTGLRIGLAAAQGIALTLNRPVVGVSALDALAWMAMQERRAGSDAIEFVAPWMDAQRGDVFAALYRINGSASRDQGSGIRDQGHKSQASSLKSGVRDQGSGIRDQGPGIMEWTVVDEPQTGRPSAVLESWKPILGDSHTIFTGDAVSRDAIVIDEIGRGRWHAQQPSPLAPAIAQIGRRLALDGRAGKPHLLTPIYVRRPDAEIDRDRRRSS